MNCYRCDQPAVIYQRYSGRHLCVLHLCTDIESRAKRVIRQNGWLSKGDRIGIVYGMKHSLALEIFLSHLTKARDDISLEILHVPQSIWSMEDSVIAGEISQCALSCGVTRIALPDCAEDIAEKVLSNIFQGNANGLMSERFPEYGLPYMKPLREIPSEELDIYATKYRQEGNYLTDAIAESSDSPFDAAVRRMLADYSTRHPSAPHALRRYQDLLGELADRTT